MRFKIHKKSKRILILFFALVIVFSCLQLFLEIKFPETIKKDTVVYTAVCEPKLSYQVVIYPNEVIPGTKQKEGETYSKLITDYIEAEFELTYTGSKPYPLDIEYQILATVNGYQGKDADKAIFWSKIFPLTNIRNIKEDSSNKWSKKVPLNFKLGNYDAFAVRAKEITGMDVSNEIIVSMKGRIIAHTDVEDAETPFDVNIRIPLMEDIFQITKSGLDTIENNITVSESILAPINLWKTVAYAVFLIICLIGIILTLFFTREPNHEEILLKKANTTLKNYGSRIVALKNIPAMNYKQHYRVHSMKDLIKIADEIQKPIFYVTDKGTLVKDYEFHVIESDTIYSFFLDSSDD